MTDDQDLELVEQLADEFANRLRAGERPSIREYADRHPELAEIIRDTFEALAMMENMAPGSDDSFGAADDDSAATATLPELKQLGDFRIIREVGRGGMGVVYEAEQVSLGRHVALKVLPASALPDDNHIVRFEREAKSAAKLHHTNIVPVFGVGAEQDLHYYVMQFIQGLPLDEVIDELKKVQAQPTGTIAATTPVAGSAEAHRESGPEYSVADVARSLMTGQFAQTLIGDSDPDGDGEDAHPNLVQTVTELSPRAGDTSSSRLSETLNLSGSMSGSGLRLGKSGAQSSQGKPFTYWESVANIGLQVADAMQYAHEQSILHRDIKPSNLLLDLRGTAWVTDFGLAKATDQQDITHTGDILGTLRYMPPEAFEGKADARSDVYSLGLTMYELLSFQPAFGNKDRHQLIKQVTTESPPRLEKLNTEIPRDLVTIVHKAIDRDPAHRYQTARDLEEDLQRFIDDEPIKARRISTAERLVRWSRRNKGLAASLAAVCALLLVINIAGPWVTWEMATLNEELEGTVTDLEAREQELEETGRQLAAETLRANQEAEDARSEAAAKDRIAALEADARDEADRERDEADRQRLLTRRALYSSTLFAAQQANSTPDGYARAQQLLDEVRPHSGEEDLRGWEWYYLHARRPAGELVLQDFSKYPVALAFSPDGRFIATGDLSGQVRTFDAHTGRPGRTFDGQQGIVSCVAWSPDSTRIALTGDDHTARIWNLETGAEELRLVGNADWVSGVAWSPDGGRLVTAGLDGLIKTWHAASGDNLLTIEVESEVRGVDWSSDGGRLASAGDDAMVRVWDAETGEVIHVMKGHSDRVGRVRFSPDGRRIASSSWETAENAVIVWDAEQGTELLNFTGLTSGVHAVKWSLDGGQLATAGYDSGTADVWNAETGEHLHSFSGHHARLYDCSWSPDGHRLASASADNTVRVWEIGDQRSTPDFEGHQATVYELAWSHDGSRLATASTDHTVKIWDVATRRNLLTFDRHTEHVYSVDWSPDNLLLASSGMEEFFHVWEADTGQVRHTIQACDGDTVREVAWSHDGTRIASAADDGTVRVFDSATGDQLQQFRVSSSALCVDWTRDGRLAASTYSGDAIIWDTTNGQKIAHFTKPGQRLRSVCFSPSGTMLVAGGTLAPQESIFGDTGGGAHGDVTLWNLTTNQEAQQLRGHVGGIGSLDWSRDGTRLLTTDRDGKIILWDAATGSQLLAIDDPDERKVRCAYFSPNELRIATAGDAPGIRLWDTTASHAAELSPELRPVLESRIAANPTFDDMKLLGQILAREGEWEQAAASFDRAAAFAAGGSDEVAPLWFTSPWWVVGPYPEPLDAEQPPETSLNPFDPVAREAGAREQEPLRWEPTVLGADQGLNLGRFFHQSVQISGYAQLRVYSTAEQRVGILLGADDRLRLWLKPPNRAIQLVHSRDVSRIARRDDVAVEVTLQHGWNTLLAKVSNSTGEHGLFLRLSDDPRDVARVFTWNEKWTEAYAWWNRACAERPEDSQVLLGLGRAALGVGETEVADQVFDTVLADNELFALRGVASAFADHGQSLINSGQADAAMEFFDRARTLYESLLSGEEADDSDAADLANLLLASHAAQIEPQAQWTILQPTDWNSNVGTDLTPRDDGSILASQDPKQNDTYTITGRANQLRITALRLEVLPDPAVQGEGPGWAGGNFHLTEFRARLQRVGRPVVPLTFQTAAADNIRLPEEGAGPNDGAFAAIDGEHTTVWDIWPAPGQRHWLVLQLTDAIDVAEDDEIIVHLDFLDPRWPWAKLGCFRLSVTDAVFDMPDRRFLGSGIEDPWVRLGAAYAALGNSEKAVETFAQALERAPGFTARHELVQQIDELQTDLGDLLQLYPDDPLLLAAQAKRQAAGGEADEAARSLARARSRTEVLLADLMLVDEGAWTVLAPGEMTSANDSTLTRLDDDSILAGGDNPEVDTYTISTVTDVADIIAVRLDVLPDPSLPANGPGRYHVNGAFALTEFRCSAAPASSPDEVLAIEFSDVVAAFNPVDPGNRYHVRGMIDGNDATCWSIYPHFGMAHSALFVPGQKIGGSDDGTELTFELEFHDPQWKNHNLGRFRLSVTDDPTVLEAERQRWTPAEGVREWLAAEYAAVGNAIQAAVLNDMDAESLARARSLTESILAESPADDMLAGFLADLLLADQTRWTILSPEVTSEGNAEFVSLPDGSILARGPNATGDVYTIRAPVDVSGIRSIRLEALPDPSLPRRGPGRHASGNFQLQALRLFAGSESGRPAERLPINDAWASFEYHGPGRIQAAIDDDDPRIWHVFGRYGERHVAVFDLATPLELQSQQQLIVECAHADRVAGVNLGRFRLSVTDDPHAIEWHQQRTGAFRIEDPRLRLAAAYAALGESTRAAAWFTRALDGDASLTATLDQIAELPADLRDQVLDWSSIDLTAEDLLARSSDGIRQQVWTRQPVHPFKGSWLRDRESIAELISRQQLLGERPTFLSLSRRSDTTGPGFVTIWTDDDRDYRMELSLTREQFDDLLDDPTNEMQLVSVEEYLDGGSTLYAALWTEQAATSPWELHERLTEAETLTLAGSMQSRGFRPTYVNAHPDGMLTTVWVADEEASELLLGMTYQDLKDLEVERADDCLPTCVDSWFDGERRRYTVIIDESVEAVEWKFSLLQPRSEFQTVFEQHRQGGWNPLVTTESPGRFETYRRLNQWDAAAADYSRLIDQLPENRKWDSQRSRYLLDLAQDEPLYAAIMRARPDDDHLRIVLGRHLALHGRWSEAADAIAPAIASAQPETEEWVEIACLLLMDDDTTGYQEFLDDISQQAAGTTDPTVAFILARTFGMSPQATEAAEQAVRWGEIAVRAEGQPWHLHALGLARYRAGQLEQAVRTLEASNELAWRTGHSQNWIVLAMAHFDLGDVDTAREWLARADAWRNGLLDGAQGGRVNVQSIDWLAFHALRRDAGRLIENADDQTVPKTRSRERGNRR